MLGLCHSISCTNHVTSKGDDFCPECRKFQSPPTPQIKPTPSLEEEVMSTKYPKYYKSVGDMTEVDVYAVHKLFDIKDPSGAIQHASKKLLLSGVRTGGKSTFNDVKEARDTLTRWMQLYKDTQ